MLVLYAAMLARAVLVLSIGALVCAVVHALNEYVLCTEQVLWLFF